MKISSRFTVAVHILALVKVEQSQPLTSSWIASSVNTNAVVIRRLVGKLKQANLIKHSKGWWHSTKKPLTDITLLDVYQAVEVVDEGVFQMHEDTNVELCCRCQYQSVLEIILLRAQDAMEGVLANVTMDDIVTDILQQKRISRRPLYLTCNYYGYKCKCDNEAASQRPTINIKMWRINHENWYYQTTGKVGNKVLTEAQARGHEVTAIVRNASKLNDQDVKVIEKDIFSLTVDDIEDLDVVVNAFGAPLGEEEAHVEAGR